MYLNEFFWLYLSVKSNYNFKIMGFANDIDLMDVTFSRGKDIFLGENNEKW